MKSKRQQQQLRNISTYAQASHIIYHIFLTREVSYLPQFCISGIVIRAFLAILKHDACMLKEMTMDMSWQLSHFSRNVHTTDHTFVSDVLIGQ